mmetsp:Transcript_78401/g.199320  ORF Transcript_78401/g.199320 Transcript_78401/m.199320 type:complete len:214 (+) Transcript_78401:733-1374(+)
MDIRLPEESTPSPPTRKGVSAFRSSCFASTSCTLCSTTSDKICAKATCNSGCAAPEDAVPVPLLRSRAKIWPAWPTTPCATALLQAAGSLRMAPSSEALATASVASLSAGSPVDVGNGEDGGRSPRPPVEGRGWAAAWSSLTKRDTALMLAGPLLASTRTCKFRNNCWNSGNDLPPSPAKQPEALASFTCAPTRSTCSCESNFLPTDMVSKAL